MGSNEHMNGVLNSPALANMSSFRTVETVTRMAVVGLLTMLPTSVHGEAPGPLVITQRLLAAAFPDLRGNDTRISIVIDSAFESDWALSQDLYFSAYTRTFRTPTGADADAAENRFLSAHIAFSEGHLFQASFAGQRVKSRELQAVTMQAKAHPEWTDAQLQDALLTAGAAYGMDKGEELANAIHLDRFTEAFGLLRRTDVSFKWRLGSSDLGADDIIPPEWSIKADTHDQRGRHVCYVFIAEPLGGNVTGILGGLCE